MEGKNEECRLSVEAEEGLSALPEDVQRVVGQRLCQIAEGPEEVGYSLGGRLSGKRGIHGKGYEIIWEMKSFDGERLPVILTIDPRANTNGKDPMEVLGDFVAWRSGRI